MRKLLVAYGSLYPSVRVHATHSLLRVNLLLIGPLLASLERGTFCFRPRGSFSLEMFHDLQFSMANSSAWSATRINEESDYLTFGSHSTTFQLTKSVTTVDILHVRRTERESTPT